MERIGPGASFKIYECEDCSGCPFKPACTKAEGNHQIHWNAIWEEMKAKAKKAACGSTDRRHAAKHRALGAARGAKREDDEKSAIYARCKVEVEIVLGYIKGNRSFRRFSLRGLKKVHTEFGIAALAHNLLKVAGLRLAA